MNKKVIYTVITGGYDTLKNQPKQDGYDFICFTDNKAFHHITVWGKIV